MTTSHRHCPSGLAVATALVLGIAATGAGAVPLNTAFTGQSYLDTALPGTTDAARPELSGVVLQDVDTPFVLGNLTGYVQNRVVREDGTGTLDFYWRVVVDSTSSGDGINALRIGNFGYSDLTDADWRIDGLGTIPASTGQVFNPADYPAGDINFQFGSAVAPGDSSSFFFLHTDATNYAETALYDVWENNDTFTGTFSTFAPAVPEPTPAATLALGLMALGWLRGRRVRSRD